MGSPARRAGEAVPAALLAVHSGRTFNAVSGFIRMLIGSGSTTMSIGLLIILGGGIVIVVAALAAAVAMRRKKRLCSRDQPPDDIYPLW